MRVWHDWEFLEDGRTIEPISLGMIREDGKTLYRVFVEAPWNRIKNDEWLMANVMPTLSAKIDNVFHKAEIREHVTQFLFEATLDSRSRLELWGWYSAYDHVCLAQLFGKMIDLPEWCPQLTKDLKQEFLEAGVDRHPSIPRQSTGLHNALDDASHLMAKHLWFDDYKAKLKLQGNSGFQIGNGNVQHNRY